MATYLTDRVTIYPREVPPTRQLVREMTQAMECQNRDDAFIMVDLSQVFLKLDTWHRLLPRVLPFYAMKCNPDPEVCRFLASAGAGFDCASKGEIEQILDLGVHPSRIVYANPCKVCTHLRYARDRKVDLMTFDDVHELIKVEKYFPDARLLLRIQSSLEHKAKYNFNKKFGCDIDDAPKLLRTAREMGLNVVGVSFHVGSLPDKVDCFESTIKKAHNVFLAGEDAGFYMSVLDIGGGFPGVDAVDMTFEEVADTVNRALNMYFPASKGTQIIAEPGRYFVTSAFTVAVNIISKRVLHLKSGKSESSQHKKKSTSNSFLGSKDNVSAGEEGDEGADREKNKIIMYYINEGIYGAFNNVLNDQAIVYPQLPMSSKSSETFTSVIWGPTCDCLDCVLPECQLPDLGVGQWLYFQNMGAYTISSACSFNGIKRPMMFYVCADVFWNHVFYHTEETALSKILRVWTSSTGAEMPLELNVTDTDSGKGLCLA